MIRGVVLSDMENQNNIWLQLKNFITEWKDNIDFSNDLVENDNTDLSNKEFDILEKILETMERLEMGDDISYTHIEGNLYIGKDLKLYNKVSECVYKLSTLNFEVMKNNIIKE